MNVVRLQLSLICCETNLCFISSGGSVNDDEELTGSINRWKCRWNINSVTHTHHQQGQEALVRIHFCTETCAQRIMLELKNPQLLQHRAVLNPIPSCSMQAAAIPGRCNHAALWCLCFCSSGHWLTCSQLLSGPSLASVTQIVFILLKYSIVETGLKGNKRKRSSSLLQHSSSSVISVMMKCGVIGSSWKCSSVFNPHLQAEISVTYRQTRPGLNYSGASSAPGANLNYWLVVYGYIYIYLIDIYILIITLDGVKGSMWWFSRHGLQSLVWDCQSS